MSDPWQPGEIITRRKIDDEIDRLAILAGLPRAYERMNDLVIRAKTIARASRELTAIEERYR